MNNMTFLEGSDTKMPKRCGLDGYDDFLVFHQYKDAETFKLIGAVCEVAGAPLATVLEIFGEYFLQYCLRHGYDKMLRTLGEDFQAFIQNLDSLHALLAMSYKNIEAPSFRCEDNADGTLSLHYYTIRPGLYPIVLGLVKAVARDLYQQNATIEVISKKQEIIQGGKTQEHVAFKVVLENRINGLTANTLAIEKFNPAVPDGFHISAKQFCHAFPYHIIFDNTLKIKQCGLMIQKMLQQRVEVGAHINNLFDIIHPRMTFTLDNVRMFINTIFMLGVRKISKTGRRLVLKGQMLWLEDIQHIIFISSPRISSLSELMEMNVFLSDIPLYDVTRELVLLNQQRIAEIDIA
ncbi:hypothetical protein KUTeg_020502 [Tegillarca granosa]|uniref:guanylate cyclase n=1 Tax=Tegillarca granosa TaxID=220873 RepID=A0ABQ9EDJ1_TEGGR|nr:hypothetical protein KUTeg_020502 [Tegillarca granosa]